MARIYTFSTTAGITAVQDILSLLATTGMAFELHEVVIGQATGTTVSDLAVSIKRQSGTITPGTGGSVVVGAKANFGDAAATVTGRGNDTGIATATTTAVLRRDVYSTVNTYQYWPAPEDRFVFAPGQQCVISLDTAPGASQATSITVTIAELF